MNTSTRNLLLSDAQREIMRPMSLSISQALLAGQLYGTAACLFWQAVDVVILERDEEGPVPEGWEDYYQDCLDLVESYKILNIPQLEIVWKMLLRARGMSGPDLVVMLSTLELHHSAQRTRQNAGQFTQG